MSLSLAAFSKQKKGAFCINLALIMVGVFAFALSHPNILFKNGLSPLAWFMYIPVLLVIYRSKLPACILWGALYGYAALSLLSYWVGTYHFLAGVIVGLIYLCYFAALFAVLKLVVLIFPRLGYLVQLPIWVAFEYLRTLGFVGYSYGITGYTQWQNIAVIQSASIFGVWAISALVLFPSLFLAQMVVVRGRFSSSWIPLLVYLIVLAANISYGKLSPQDYEALPKARIALIQNNADPWKDEKEDYRNNFRALRRLSEEALAVEPKPELVVWSETAFIPMIYWNLHYRTDSEYYAQIKELLDFLERQDVPFLIGNDDGRRITNEYGLSERIDYNAAILFNKTEITEIYRKIHLVPFAEYFPYKKQLPFIYKLLEKTDTHFWEAGKNYTVFTAAGWTFSTPICFEDTFGYLAREFVRSGAELIVNLTNDSWSASLPAQMQHLSMAVFRSVENHRSSARSTASGQTCGIEPNGKVLAMLEPFTEAKLIVDLPVLKELTFYTRHGDFLPFICIALSVLILLCGTIRHIIIHYAKSKKNTNRR